MGFIISNKADRFENILKSGSKIIPESLLIILSVVTTSYGKKVIYKITGKARRPENTKKFKRL